MMLSGACGYKPEHETRRQAYADHPDPPPGKIAGDGDRDGLPNVLMEAQSQGVACLSTRISGIPELIVHGETGWLVEQQDTDALGEALLRLIRNADERERLAIAGCERVRQEFSMQRGIDRLMQRLQPSLGDCHT